MQHLRNSGRSQANSLQLATLGLSTGSSMNLLEGFARLEKTSLDHRGLKMLEIAVVIIGSVVGAVLIYVAVNLQVKIRREGD